MRPYRTALLIFSRIELTSDLFLTDGNLPMSFLFLRSIHPRTVESGFIAIRRWRFFYAHGWAVSTPMLSQLTLVLALDTPCIHPKIYALTCGRFHGHQLWQKNESFVGAWILECIEDKLGRDQFGAIKRRSTVHALISMTHLWSCALDKGDLPEYCLSITPKPLITWIIQSCSTN